MLEISSRPDDSMRVVDPLMEDASNQKLRAKVRRSWMSFCDVFLTGCQALLLRARWAHGSERYTLDEISERFEEACSALKGSVTRIAINLSLTSS
jgi:hypothetical protein